MVALICAIFFVSGSSALIFETLWFHQAGIAFGNSIWASSLVLSGFMAGLALGNALAAKRGDRLGPPMRAYAVLEVCIGIAGVALVYALPDIGVAFAPLANALADYPSLLNPARFLIAFVLLAIPSTAMGITLPILTKALVSYDNNFGRVLGRLYGWNTLGAVLGVVVSETILVAAIGIRGTALAAGALNLCAAAAAIVLFTRMPQRPLEAQTAPRATRLRTQGWVWLAAASLSGFALLALEIIWFRFLSLYFATTTLAFALMLAVVLSGIALGGLVASKWLRRHPGAYRFSATVAFAGGILCLLSYWASPLFIDQVISAKDIVTEAKLLYIGLPLMFPVSFISGIFFVLIGAGLRHELHSEAETTGTLTLANTVGAALGSLVGGFMLLPSVGMEKSLLAVAVIYCVVGLVLLLSAGSDFYRRVAFAGMAVFATSLWFFPYGDMEKIHLHYPAKLYLSSDEGIVKETREGLVETVIYIERQMLGEPLSYSMITNSSSMSGTAVSSRRYMKLYAYFPVAIHPHLENCLLISYGVGNTAKAMTDTRDIKSIDVVDISRDVLAMNSIVYPDKSELPLNDPRVHVHVEDGRYYLQTTEKHFDLITGEPPPPRLAGVVNLYTKEYFQLIYDRLADGGLTTYWLPLHDLTEISTKAILRSFCDVFKDCSLWHGMGLSLMMVGTKNAHGPVSAQHFVRQWGDPKVLAEMKKLGFERPEQLGALFIGDAKYINDLIGNGRALVDNYPKVIMAPSRSVKEVDRLYESWLDVQAAKDRFRSSPFIKNLWPAEYLESTLPYFDHQGIINAYWFPHGVASGASDPHAMERINYILTRTDLSAPALWLLGSNADIQDVVARAADAESVNPVLQYHVAARLISERNYTAAIGPLSLAQKDPRFQKDATQYLAYMLCMTNRCDDVQKSAHEDLLNYLSKGRKQGVPDENADAALAKFPISPFWQWMKANFGVDPRLSVREARG